MHRMLLAIALLMTLAAAARTPSQAQVDQQGHAIVAVTPDQVLWLTPTYYTDGRQRAHLYGDSGRDGAWVDRVKIPGHSRVLAHTHSSDELVTVIQGTWYLGTGERFDSTKLQGYPAGSFIVIPAGVPHFVATREGPVIVQVTGTDTWTTNYLER